MVRFFILKPFSLRLSGEKNLTADLSAFGGDAEAQRIPKYVDKKELVADYPGSLLLIRFRNLSVLHDKYFVGKFHQVGIVRND